MDERDAIAPVAAPDDNLEQRYLVHLFLFGGSRAIVHVCREMFSNNISMILRNRVLNNWMQCGFGEKL